MFKMPPVIQGGWLDRAIGCAIVLGVGLVLLGKELFR